MGNRIIVYTLFIVICLLYLVNVVLNNNSTVVGIRLYDTTQALQEVRNQNIGLQDQILEYRSLRVISKEAAENGFVPAQVYYLK